MTYDYLIYEDFILINKMTIEKHGGNFNPPENTLHPEALKYLIESVGAEMFGEPLYPTLADKAALYLFNVVSNHIFSDGNKRTGLEAALLFLRLHGYGLVSIAGDDQSAGPMTNKELTAFVLEVASARYSLEEVREWFASRIRLLRE